MGSGEGYRETQPVGESLPAEEPIPEARQEDEEEVRKNEG